MAARTRKMRQADFEAILGLPPGSCDEKVIETPLPESPFTEYLRKHARLYPGQEEFLKIRFLNRK